MFVQYKTKCLYCMEQSVRYNETSICHNEAEVFAITKRAVRFDETNCS